MCGREGRDISQPGPAWGQDGKLQLRSFFVQQGKTNPGLAGLGAGAEWPLLVSVAPAVQLPPVPCWAWEWGKVPCEDLLQLSGLLL